MNNFHRSLFGRLIIQFFIFFPPLFSQIGTAQLGSNSLDEPTEPQKNDEPVYYAESWKKGETQIEEQKYFINLNTKNLKFEVLVKDNSGTPTYKLLVEPPIQAKTGTYSEGNWVVQLFNTNSSTELLRTSKTVGDYLPVEDTFNWLYPVEDRDWKKTGFLGIPLSAKRVFKVEGFFCVITVKSYNLNREKWRGLDSIEIEIELTNNYKLGWRKV